LWLGYVLASPIRRLLHDPPTILNPFVTTGMTVLEPGPGMGFFTLELARHVGPTGRVVAIDVQPRMLAAQRRRAARAQLQDVIETRLVAVNGMVVDDLAGQVDFVLAFAVVHELPDPGRFFGEVARALKDGGRLLVAEPNGHVTAAEFEVTLGLAQGAERPELLYAGCLPTTPVGVLLFGPVLMPMMLESGP
jgi:ubiquinone/menaquinone biosynthesis C-methylase UbiE